MRTRLVAVLTTLVVLVVAGLAVPLGGAYATHRTGRLLLDRPLGGAYATHRTGRLLLDRRADATRFAELADLAARTGDRGSLQPEIARYASLYGASVWIRDRDGRVVAQAGPATGPDTTAPPAASDRTGADQADPADSAGRAGGGGQAEATGLALSGRTTDALPALTPFGPRHVLIAEPSGRDAQISGAVLLLAPTSHARADIARVWSALLLAALAVLACSVLVARGLARWILRPVTELDEATRRITEGDLGTRTAATVGPPELRRLEQRFNAMAEAVDQAVRRQREFAANASHELRNPLAALMFRLENLRPYLDPAGEREFEETGAELNRLAGTVTDLLELARTEAGAQGGAGAAVARDLDVAAELRPRLESWREVFDALGIGFAVRLPERLTARAVPDALPRIADILLDNAHKFVPEGGTVTVTLDAAGPVLRVADDGLGLTGPERARALERHWRAPAHADLPGSGLGLPIAAALAEASGGRLVLLANRPRGLAVEVRLGAGQPKTDR
ncbi:sensor histidine kinase [Actinomadura logoneensis]|uniref:histidine kinase n=1 Tax=Actinomadura logoneensis TaxID=2293572 RepID=A0A372JLM6_9ACTN|nr:HAMP domain-containing sensor histidine kinase [Actinomadura logoneensis]RFU40917.1 sensor histidine kinase [Actinomadura logoneensis]